MGTTVTTATLTVSLTETITLNGTTYDQTVNHSLTDIGNYMKKILPLGVSATHVVNTFSSTPRNNEFDVEDFKYIRVTNLDDANEIIVNFVDASTETAAIQVEAGKSVVLFDSKVAGDDAGATQTSASAISELKIHNPNASIVDVEVVIATE